MSASLPIADLRKKPQHLSQDFSHDDNRESQILFGEPLDILSSDDEWLQVKAPEQQMQGYIHRSEYSPERITPTHIICTTDEPLSFGTLVAEKTARPIPKTPSRKQLIEDALLFLNMPYLWGGRGHYMAKPIASVDCSGLINLLFRAQGVQIPRDSAPQAAFGRKVERLQPGDLIYLGEPISHVILKLDETHYIEAPETGKCVRLLKWNHHVWEEGGKLRFFDREKSYTQHYRDLLPL